MGKNILDFDGVTRIWDGNPISPLAPPTSYI
jgi:hypothetical protein